MSTTLIRSTLDVAIWFIERAESAGGPVKSGAYALFAVSGPGALGIADPGPKTDAGDLHRDRPRTAGADHLSYI